MKSFRIISLIIPLIAIIGIMSLIVYDISINQVFAQTNDSDNKTGSQNSTDTFDMKGGSTILQSSCDIQGHARVYLQEGDSPFLVPFKKICGQAPGFGILPVFFD